MSFDAIIIGGGHNGLAAGITLQKRGFKVCVVEARNEVGGLCAPRQFHPGFTVPGIFHDTFEVRPGLVDALNLGSHGLSFREAEVPVYAPAKNGKGLLLWDDAEKSAAELGSDADGYRELFRMVEKAKGALSAALNEAPPPMIPSAMGEYMEMAKLGLSLRRLGTKDFYELLRMLPMCLGDMMRDHFKNDLTMAAVAGGALMGEYAGPWSAGTGARWLLMRAVSTREVKGGPAALVAALSKSFTQLGGTVRTGAKVAQVVVDKNRVKGVRLASGEEVLASRVGCAINPKAALLDLVPPGALPLEMWEPVRNVRCRGTSARVHLALESPIQPQGRAGETFERIRIGESLDELERAFDAVKYATFSAVPALDIRQPTVADASLAPAGKHVAGIWVNFAPHDLRGGWSDGKQKEVLDAVLARLEAYDPAIKKKVIAAEVVDPSQLEKEFGLPGGNVHHGEMALDQMLFMRPTPALSHYKTPLEGLFLCGSGAHPGGGVTLAPGALGAAAIS
jgi:phytoene dehydrogenase-like protein